VTDRSQKQVRFRDVGVSVEERFEALHGLLRASCVERGLCRREQGVEIASGFSSCGCAGHGLGCAAAQ
jgi:hypothetical protein